MKSTPKGFTDLMMRSMVVPEEVDIRNYQVISFEGKLKKLTGTKNNPYKMISLLHNSRVITIQVFFIKEERKAFINKLIYEKYQSEIANYFSSKPEENPAALVNNNNGEKKFTNHNPQTNDKDKDSQECEYDKKHIESTNDAGNYSNIKWQHLRDYLLSDFGERKYKRKSIIDIYCYDRDYYISLKRGKKVEKDAVIFFDSSCALLEEAQIIPTEAFRKLKYAEIVDDYIRELFRKNPTGNLKTSNEKDIERKPPSKEEIISKKSESDKKQAVKIIISDNSNKAKNPKSLPLHCVNDFSVLIKNNEIRVRKKKGDGNFFTMPVYECPQCKRLYTSISEYKDLAIVRLQGEKYTNLSVLQDSDRYRQYLIKPHSLEPDSKCFVYQSKKPEECRLCKNRDLKTRGVISADSEQYHTRVCLHCNIHYLKWNVYSKRNKEWILLNPEEYHSIFEEQEKLREKEERLREEQRKKQEEKKAEIKARRELQKQEKLRRKLDQERKRQEELLLRKKTAEKQRMERELRDQQIKHSLQQYDLEVKNHLSERTGSEKEHDKKIRVKDFVVRRTVFKCMHEGHSLTNIDGVIEIINDKGDVIQTKVPAGYCPSCDVFFIMESTYQRLKMRGTPICRISDEKAYMKSNINPNGMRLAQESILMQYGYSVSQQEGLSGSRRNKILAVLIDNDILTRTEIISYLDFFINQRKNNLKYEKAIEKWEMDREFVAEYRMGAYKKYGISGILRK